MPPEAIAAALLSALIHAGWNALLKAGHDRLADTVFVAAGWLVLSVVLIAGKGLPPAAAWPYVVGSGAVHLVYWIALVKGYDAGDLSHVYTLARGMAPALVAFGGVVAAAEIPSLVDAAGIALVCLGILNVGANPRAPWRASLWAVITGSAIALYSLIDALGARVTGDAVLYVGWMFLSNALAVGAYALWRRRAVIGGMAAAGAWRRGFVAGGVSALGYGLVLWAQVRAPIAEVTALRESSVVFAALIAWLFLKEPLNMRRGAGAVLVMAGAIAIAVG